MREAGGFTVNLLAAGREELALRFATKSGNKFASIESEDPPIPEGGPILSNDSVGYAVCTTYSEIEAGDHWIFVGAVSAGRVHPDENPLVYGRRQFAAWDDVG
jgi:flavin reductase (DIM6/NTAB) family NADH-FMN oxidoreductase RutF